MTWLKDWLGAAGMGTLVGLLLLGGWPAAPAVQRLQPPQRAGAQPCADPSPRTMAVAGHWSSP